jgi:hypothetical protein
MTPAAPLTSSPSPSLPPVAPSGAPTGNVKNLPAARLLIGLAAPLGVGLVALLGWLVMKSFNLAYQRELLAATIISIAAGALAVLPMLLLMSKGAIAIVRLTMVAMLVRMGLTFAGLLLACGPGWRLDAGVLVVCTAGCYLAVMVAESAATLWATRM